ESIWTSALATAAFLSDQLPHGAAYVIGEAGLTTALHEVGYTVTDRDPDFVVLGETRTYSFEAITRGIRLVEAGARFIARTPTSPGPPKKDRCRPPARWPPSSPAQRGASRTSSASRTR